MNSTSSPEKSKCPSDFCGIEFKETTQPPLSSGSLKSKHWWIVSQSQNGSEKGVLERSLEEEIGNEWESVAKSGEVTKHEIGVTVAMYCPCKKETLTWKPL